MTVRVDHLVFAAPDLELGCDAIERLLGVRPVFGGRHPCWGTHNSLLSLGPETYLEVIAPDPSLAAPARGVLFEADSIVEPRFVTWALRTDTIEATVAAAGREVGLGPIKSGSRQPPAGDLLTWRLTDPYALPCGGAVPFLIDWGDTPHPAATVPRAGNLVDLRLDHPAPDRVGMALAAIGAELDVRVAPQPALIATIETESGTVELR